MRKLYTIILFTMLSAVAFGQSNLEYSGFFDSYYTRGPLKFTFEPGISYMVGDLSKVKLNSSIGAGANYRIWPVFHANVNFRYISFGATDQSVTRGISYTGNTMQLNLLGNYHIIYDRIRLQKDRKRGPRQANLYVSTGLSLNRYKASAINDDVSDFSINDVNCYALHIPLMVGVPIRINPKWAIIPELGYYITFSDKFDGIDNRSSTSNNDGYGVFTLKIQFNPKGKVKKKIKFATGSISEGGESGGGGSDSFNEEGDAEDVNLNDNSDSEDIEENNIEEQDVEIEEDTEEEIIEEEAAEEEESEDGYYEEEDDSEDGGEGWD